MTTFMIMCRPAGGGPGSAQLCCYQNPGRIQAGTRHFIYAVINREKGQKRKERKWVRKNSFFVIRYKTWVQPKCIDFCLTSKLANFFIMSTCASQQGQSSGLFRICGKGATSLGSFSEATWYGRRDTRRNADLHLTNIYSSMDILIHKITDIKFKEIIRQLSDERSKYCIICFAVHI